MSRARHKARRYAVQALYQWQLTAQDISGVVRQFMLEYAMRDEELAYFREAAEGVVAACAELDAHLQPHLDRGIEAVDPVERAILRLGAWELAQRPEVPFRVVINEGVELAKVFGAEHGHRFINGVLDKTAASLRAVEARAPRRPR